MNIVRPYVTVVVPSFNEDPHIIQASLESIRIQTFADFECIVVDESTNPELAEACQAFCALDSRFFYIHPNERIGLPKSLNLAISKARGQVIARFDSDDVCMPERLELQVAFLQSHPEISLVGGALEIISKEGKLLAQRSYPLLPIEIAKGMQLTTTIAHPTVMYRKVAIDQHGGYNTKFRFSEDLELWLRWINAGLQFANLPQVLVQYRQDNTRRGSGHWFFNLRARIANFNAQFLARRIIGIACIVSWVFMPKKLQEQIFKALVLRRRRKEVAK